MRKLIFGGTTEGREAARQCAAAGDRMLVCVASEAGRRALGEGVECRVGRLDAGGMIALARSFGAEAIVDATHPFAKAVSENVRACAAATGLPLERIERNRIEHDRPAERICLFPGEKHALHHGVQCADVDI